MEQIFLYDEIKKPSTDEWGIVLCGGGAKGAYQIGAWKYLNERGFLRNVTGFSGDSIGAINELMIACLNPRMAEQIWNEIEMFTVFDIEPDKLDMVEGTFSRKEMLELMRKYIDYDSISMSRLNLFVNITRLDNGSYDDKTAVYEILNNKSPDEIEHIVMASSALPVVYEAVQYKGYLYRDGGLTDNMPILPLYRAGYKHILVLALDNEATVNYEDYPGCEIVLIKPSMSLGDLLSGTLDFTNRNIRLRIDLGYKDMRRNYLSYFDKDENVIQNYDIYKESDIKEVFATSRREKLDDMVNYNMGKLQDIIDKYGV